MKILNYLQETLLYFMQNPWKVKAAVGCVTGYQVIQVIQIFATFSNSNLALYSEKSISEFYLFEITGLCFSIRRYLCICRQHQQFAHYSNTFLYRYPDMIFN